MKNPNTGAILEPEFCMVNHSCLSKSHTKFRLQDPPCVRVLHAGDLYTLCALFQMWIIFSCVDGCTAENPCTFVLLCKMCRATSPHSRKLLQCTTIPLADKATRVRSPDRCLGVAGYSGVQVGGRNVWLWSGWRSYVNFSSRVVTYYTIPV